MDSLEVQYAAARAWFLAHPEVNDVYVGVKVTAGRRTGERAIVFTVERKRPIAEIAESARIPATFGDWPTDVVEGSRAVPFAVFTGTRRPCPGGYSCGHHRITAGTFGLPVKRGGSDDWLILSNNHVLANSNDAAVGDPILQPGAADDGRYPDHYWADLLEWWTITFEGAAPVPKPKAAIGRAWWKGLRAVGNAGAWATRCPYRMQVAPRAVDQPSPNLVDLALARPRQQADLLPQIQAIGRVTGVATGDLGLEVHKAGRTTGHTHGEIVGVRALARVGYGPGQVGVFDDQIIIMAPDADGFSAGGDSGSAILDGANRFVGLLFAGGGGRTIANTSANVVGLAGVRVA